MSMWFVTPAWKRYELSAVCFEQRRRVIDTLATHGIEAHCVVIADDENLDIARACGFDTVEQTNEWLGRKFNDGIEYAAAHGAGRIVPIGSDSWIDPAYFLPLPRRELTRTSGLYAAVTADRLGAIDVRDAKGAGPYIFARDLLRRSHFRPAQDEISHGVDASTVKGLRLRLRWSRHDVHPFQYVGFRGIPHLSSYEGLMGRWGVREHFDPWTILAEHYPADLVERARMVMAGQVAVAA